ncbi:unnamed protein product, partial [Symbiodinium necroappetens]
MSSRSGIGELVRQVSSSMGLPDGQKVEDMQPEQLCALLKSDAAHGLSSGKAAARLKKDGPNQLEQEPRLGLFMLFILQLTSR